MDNIIELKRPTENDRLAVRMLVRAREDFQSMRKRMDNRLGRKADGSAQNIDERVFRAEDVEHFTTISDAARGQEKVIEKMLHETLERFPIFTEWLSGVKGVGDIAAGWIVGEYDIHIATTVSKLWQFTGLNPGMVRGKKRIQHDDDTFEFVQTDTMVRGDRLTPGFVAPFNKRLRTAMVGVLADGFVKACLRWAPIDEASFRENDIYCKRADGKKAGIEKGAALGAVIEGPYVHRYMEVKQRLMHSENVCEATGKAWKDESDGHRDRYAKRAMIKLFLQDLYVAWRTLEGLPVRAPYQEEYLGHVHQG